MKDFQFCHAFEIFTHTNLCIKSLLTTFEYFFPYFIYRLKHTDRLKNKRRGRGVYEERGVDRTNLNLITVIIDKSMSSKLKFKILHVHLN